MDPGFAIVSIVQSVMVVTGIGIAGWTIVAFTRARHGKAIGAAPTPASLLPLEQRMERLEQATEAIALQVERIAEGQRFVTRLLSDSQQAQLRIGGDSAHN
jgi:hypothetical protein